MRKNKLFALLLIIPMLFCGVGTAYAGSPNEVYTVARVQSLCDGIVAYNGASSAQELIDGQLCEGAGTTAEFYVIALSQSGSSTTALPILSVTADAVRFSMLTSTFAPCTTSSVRVSFIQTSI